MIKLILISLSFLLIFPVKADDFDCMVEALYHEGRSESMIAQLAIANVILTRVESSRYPNSICEVVHQGMYWRGNPVRNRCKFSYWCDGKSERMLDTKAILKAVDVSKMALQGVQLRQTVGSTHYHASYVTPFWASDPRFKSVGSVGIHVFYIDMR